jgi:hypothetical protein
MSLKDLSVAKNMVRTCTSGTMHRKGSLNYNLKVKAKA